MIGSRGQKISIYLWLLREQAASGEEKIKALALNYLEAAGITRPAEWQVLSAITRDEKGKPYFVYMPDLFFSLSHSGDYGACVFHRLPVGLDLQIHSARDTEGIARRFFHPDEYAFLKTNDFAQFFSVWTAKESYVKYTGAGIMGGLQRFAVADEGGLKRKMGGVEFYHHEFPGKYSLCLCAGSIPGVRIIL